MVMSRNLLSVQSLSVWMFWSLNDKHPESLASNHVLWASTAALAFTKAQASVPTSSSFSSHCSLLSHLLHGPSLSTVSYSGLCVNSCSVCHSHKLASLQPWQRQMKQRCTNITAQCDTNVTVQSVQRSVISSEHSTSAGSPWPTGGTDQCVETTDITFTSDSMAVYKPLAKHPSTQGLQTAAKEKRKLWN